MFKCIFLPWFSFFTVHVVFHHGFLKHAIIIAHDAIVRDADVFQLLVAIFTNVAQLFSMGFHHRHHLGQDGRVRGVHLKPVFFSGRLVQHADKRFNAADAYQLEDLLNVQPFHVRRFFFIDQLGEFFLAFLSTHVLHAQA